MKLLPPEPTYEMLRALAGDPPLLAASDEAELRKRYQAMRDSAPEYVQSEDSKDAERYRWLRRNDVPAAVLFDYPDHMLRLHLKAGGELDAEIDRRVGISHGEGQRK